VPHWLNWSTNAPLRLGRTATYPARWGAAPFPVRHPVPAEHVSAFRGVRYLAAGFIIIAVITAAGFQKSLR
jgi:hypothetical protein